MILQNLVTKQTNTDCQSLESLVRGSGIKLKNSGPGRLVGLCPFHQEKTPSFTIYPDGRYYCFGCKEYGDVIDFLRKQRGLSYFEALDLLGRERPKDQRLAHKDYLTHQREKLNLSWRESDLSLTLGKLIRLGNKALKALRPTNFDEYCGIIENIANWERWHDVLVFGSSEDKKALLKGLEDFSVIERGLLWRKNFDYLSWLRKHKSLSIPEKKKH